MQVAEVIAIEFKVAHAPFERRPTDAMLINIFDISVNAGLSQL